MRILIDECVDWRLVRDLPGHDAKTVRQMGWTETVNGALLRLAEQLRCFRHYRQESLVPTERTALHDRRGGLASTLGASAASSRACTEFVEDPSPGQARRSSHALVA